MDLIESVLKRGVDTIYPSPQSLEKVLRSGKKIRLFQGFDPSGIQLHIGHLAGLMKLRQFQMLGHEVIFLIGDGTGQAGDPSGKKRTRDKFLTNRELRENAKDYVLQASKIIDFEGKNKAKILYNGDWLNKLSLIELLDIAGHFSLQQLEERDLYVQRKKNALEINFREFLYPLLQGYDSVAMDIDLEIGGTDQTFNMLCGRQLVRQYLNKEKFVLSVPLLADASGNKIGKTEGNVIALTSAPNDLYGMVMSLPDSVIAKSFEYITDVPLSEINLIKKSLENGHNPMTFKKKLAFELVRMLNNSKSAKDAQTNFENLFQKNKTQKTTDIVEVQSQKTLLTDLLINLKLTPSKGVAKQLIREGAVDIDGLSVKDVNFVLAPKNGIIIKVGKHKFIKLKIKEN